MHTLKLKHWQGGIYSRINYSSFPKIEILINFLIQIGGLVDLVKDGLIEDKGFYFEVVYVDVENDEVILFYIDDEDDPPFKYKMPYQKFIDLLDRWWEVYKCLPDFIEISIDDQDNIEIKAVDQ